MMKYQEARTQLYRGARGGPVLARLADQAKAKRVTKSSLIREGLVRVLHEHPSARTLSCYDLALDLAGTIKGLPEDLADDPMYMDGFGR